MRPGDRDLPAPRPDPKVRELDLRPSFRNVTMTGAAGCRRLTPGTGFEADATSQRPRNGVQRCRTGSARPPRTPGRRRRGARPALVSREPSRSSSLPNQAAINAHLCVSQPELAQQPSG